MYTNKYDVYDDINFNYYYPYRFNYLTDNFKPYSSWNYEDTSTIYFPEIEIVEGTHTFLNVFNFRYELIFTKELSDNLFSIDKDLSKNTLIKGIYPFSITQVNEEVRSTLMSSGQNYFYVK